jgi:hypothetical protein
MIFGALMSPKMAKQQVISTECQYIHKGHRHNILKEVGTLFLGRPLRAPEEQCPNRLKKMICRGEAMQT